MAEGIETALAECERQWRDGDFRGVLEAFEWCSLNGVPVPDWLASAIRPALGFAFEKGGQQGNRRAGGHLPHAKRAEIDQRRWSVATMALNMRPLLPHWGYDATREGAFRYASEKLAENLAQGSPRQIEDSFNRVQRRQSAPVKSSK